MEMSSGQGHGHEDMINLTCDESEVTSLQVTCQDLLNKSQFVDVTLSCIDGQIQAHRLVLCSVSPYLYELFTSNPTTNPCTHPMIILRDCKVGEVQLALQFIYAGKVRIPASKLGPLLNAARELGCDSLETAIKQAQHSASRPKPPAVLPSHSPPGVGGGGIKSLLSQITKAINIKTEMEQEPGIRGSASPSPNSNKSGVPPLPKLLRMTPSPVMSNSSRTSHVSPPVTIRKSPLSRPGALQLQHDKAESFVYTNENLDMMMFPDDDEGNSYEPVEQRSPEVQIQVKSEAVEGDVKPSVCPWCNQLFGGPMELQRHIKALHTNTNSHKPYSCPYCSHEFARSAHLKRHIRCLHTSEKPYKCDYCDKEFSRQDKMKIHVNRHLQGSIPVMGNNNEEILRVCYPPVALSQNAGGQVPIKILVPKNNPTGVSFTSSSSNGTEPLFMATQFHPDSAPVLSPSSFFIDRSAASILINNPTSMPSQMNHQPKRSPHVNPVAN